MLQRISNTLCINFKKSYRVFLLVGVRKHIREEFGDSKFCINVDKARDESNKEQMSRVKIC
jgi:hypothetical protein